MRKILNILAIAVCIGLVFTSCKKEGVKSITLDKTELGLEVGATHQLVATTDPADEKLTWATSSSDVATLSNTGLVTAIKEGQAIITAKAGGKTATCLVMVGLEQEQEKITKEGVVMRLIPAGTFLMGSPDSEPNRALDETQHPVTLTKDFYMSKYQITNAQYAAFLNDKGVVGTPNLAHPYLVGEKFTGAVCTWGDNSGQHLVYDASTNTAHSSYDWGVIWSTDKWVAAAGFENHPVIWVTWFGAVEYAAWIGGVLPTEAQWEYACRGGQSESLPFGIGDGTKLIGGMANFYVQFSYDKNASPAGEYIANDDHTTTHYKDKTTAVGFYSSYANGYGLYDMHGNVFEWCNDRYDSKYGSVDASSAATDPVGATDGSSRVLRGGNWFYNAQYCRSAFRYGGNPDYTNYLIGLRVAFVP